MNATFLEKANNYCEGSISLNDLRLWIAENIDIVFDTPDSIESSLAAFIEDVIIQANELDADHTFVRNAIAEKLSQLNSEPIDIHGGSSNLTFGDIPAYYESQTQPMSSAAGNLFLVVSMS